MSEYGNAGMALVVLPIVLLIVGIMLFSGLYLRRSSATPTSKKVGIALHTILALLLLPFGMMNMSMGSPETLWVSLAMLASSAVGIYKIASTKSIA